MCVLKLKPLGADNPVENEGWVGTKAMLTNGQLLTRIRNSRKTTSLDMYKRLTEYFKKPKKNVQLRIDQGFIPGR